MKTHIEWNKVTPLSKKVAVAAGVLIFLMGVWLGMTYQANQNSPTPAYQMEG